MASRRSILYALLVLSACGDITESGLFQAYMKRRGCGKIEEFCAGLGVPPVSPSPSVPPVRPTSGPAPFPTPTAPPVEPTPTPIITPEKDCSLIRFGDGRGGTLFLKSHTQSGWKFLTPGLYGKPDKVFFCTKGQCSAPKPPFPQCGGFANPDHTPQGKIERWHSCTPKSAEEVRIDDCPPLKVPRKCRRKGRCD